jgi:hypothetical protein
MMELLPWSELSRVEPLLAASGHAEGLPGWYAALAETTLARGETPAFAVAFRGSVIAGVVPVVIGPRGLRALTAPYTTRFAPFLPDVDVAYKMGMELCGFADGRVWLEGLDFSDPAGEALVRGLCVHRAAAAYDGFAAWSQPVENFAAYWQARPSRLKATVRRKAAAVDEAFLYCGGEALSTYEEIQRTSWKGPEPHPEFLSAMVRHLASAVRIGVLEIDGRAVAAQIWLVHGGRATIFKLVHRAEASAASPGTLLTHHMIERCLRDEAVSVLDFGRGDDNYKRDWMSVRAVRRGVIAGDWRCVKGLRTIATEVFPTWAGRAWRRQFGPIRDGSVAAHQTELLAPDGSRRTVPAEAS